MHTRRLLWALLIAALAMLNPAHAADVGVIERVGGQSAAVEALVADWADAWRNGDLAAYTRFYVKGYSGAFASSADWREHRRQRIEGRRDIAVDIDTLLVRVEAGMPDRAEALFVQRYRSSTWCDVVEKTLQLQRTANGWRINNEQARTRTRC